MTDKIEETKERLVELMIHMYKEGIDASIMTLSAARQSLNEELLKEMCMKALNERPTTVQ